jgi:hypothetical protein
MNRFGTYLQTMKLTKLYLTQAEEFLSKGNEKAALRDTIHAMNEFVTCLNNLASMLKEPRRGTK